MIAKIYPVPFGLFIVFSTFLFLLCLLFLVLYSTLLVADLFLLVSDFFLLEPLLFFLMSLVESFFFLLSFLFFPVSFLVEREICQQEPRVRRGLHLPGQFFLGPLLPSLAFLLPFLMLSTFSFYLDVVGWTALRGLSNSTAGR
jgi:hypothetical protein